MRFAPLLVVCGLLLAGCVTTVTPIGNMTDLQEVDFTQDFKTGESCATYYLIFGPFGNSSAVEAAKAAGIAKVEVAEYRYEWNVFTAKHCVVVHGQ